jgi:hypothetical protein
MTTEPDRKTVLYFIALIASLAFVWFSGPARPTWAQGPGLGLEVSPQALTPTFLSYQGRITDPATGNPISGTVSIIFRIYDAPAGGNKLWEDGKDVQVVSGLFSTALGDITPMDPAMFNGQSLWLAVKLGVDAEAVPRQQFLPVASALTLVPGATISTTAASPALTVKNAGSGDALRVEGRVYVTGDLAVGGNLIGGAHNHDATYINSLGPDTMSGKDSVPILSLTQSGTGYGGYFTSIDGTGMRGDTRSTVNETAGLLGIAGPTSTALNGYAGVFGKSRYGYGVAGISDSSPGVTGQSTGNYGVYGLGASNLAAVYGTNTSTGPGVQGRSNSAIGVRGDTWSTSQPGVYGGNWANPGGAGVQGYSQYGWSGYFNGGGLGALYAGGPSTVAGILTTQKVAYSTPRPHYVSVAGEAFRGMQSAYPFVSGWGGAYFNGSTAGVLIAPVQLPDGALVQYLTAYLYDATVNNDINVALERHDFVGNSYSGVSALYSSGNPGYTTLTSGLLNHTVSNTSGGYYVYAWADSSTADLGAVKVVGALIQYTISEAE